MIRAAGIVLALLTSGCAVPVYLPYTHDYGQLCAIDGDALCEVRQRETGWYKDYLLAPCPKTETLSSRTTVYKRTYDLSTGGSAPVDSAAVDVGPDPVWRSGDQPGSLIAFARDRLGLPAALPVREALQTTDPPFARCDSRDLGGAEAESLRRLGYTPPARADGGRDTLLRWDGPDGRWYLAYGPGGAWVCGQGAGVGRHRPLAASPNGYSPIWDPARRRVAFVESDDTRADPPAAVTIWDYAADRVTTHRLHRP